MVRILMEKEWAEVLRNRLVLITTAIAPLVITLVALGQLAATRYIPRDPEDPLPAAFRKLCEQQGLEDIECMQGVIGNQFMLLFLLLPLVIPVIIASYSVVGEKVSRSLEPLLATPASTTEILLGKSLAAALPAVGATWLAFGLFQLAAWFIAFPRVHELIVDPKWWVAMVLVAPLLSVMSVNVAMMISSRVNDPRAAEQLGMLVMLPLLAVFAGQALGWVTLTLGGILLTSLLLLGIDALLVIAGVRLFQRETILTRWR